MNIVGSVKSLWRYPVKSMAGEEMAEAFIGYAGVYGDRCYAFLNKRAPAGFPFLTGRTRPEMLLYRARFRDAALASRPPNQGEAEKLGPGITPVFPEKLAVDVLMASGETFAVDDPALVAALAGKGAEAEDLSLARSDRALTDCRPISLISNATLRHLGDETGIAMDARRFRANIYADFKSGDGFVEDAYVGRNLRIGERAVIAVLDRDPRCKMISLDPDTAEESSAVFRNVAQAHGGNAGVYCAVLTEGMVRAGDPITVLD